MTGPKLSPTVSRQSNQSLQQQGPPPAEAASSELWLKGHLQHLTPAEEKSFEEFKKICADSGLYVPATPEKRASHTESTLIRYLRARRFVPQDAFAQFADTEKWRKENNLDALYEKIDINDFWEARSMYPQWTGRRDKRGIPVYLYEVHKLNSKKLNAYLSSTSKAKPTGPSPTRMLRLFALYENLTRFVMPLCTAVPTRANPETPVDQSNNIVDISKVGLKQFWNLKSHMQDASQLATAHYPETLDRIFILGAPSFFPTVWGWIKRWFDPITTSKIFILSQHQVLPTLTQFIDIESIPKKYGGQLDFECGDTPVLDPAIRACLTIAPGADVEKFFLTAPVRWVDGESNEDIGDPEGEVSAIGVGSLNGKERSEHLATLHSKDIRISASAAVTPMPTNDLPPFSSPPDIIAAPIVATTATTSAIPNGVPITGAAPTDPVSHNGNQDGKLTEKRIDLPPPPTEIERTKTEYLTPASNPEDIPKILA